MNKEEKTDEKEDSIRFLRDLRAAFDGRFGFGRQRRHQLDQFPGQHISGIYSLTGIELFDNIDYLYVDDNCLTKLDLSNNPTLKTVYCTYNDLTELNVSGCPALQNLICYNNDLETLDLSGNPNLIMLGCGNNQLKNLTLCGPSMSAIPR